MAVQANLRNNQEIQKQNINMSQASIISKTNCLHSEYDKAVLQTAIFDIPKAASTITVNSLLRLHNIPHERRELVTNNQDCTDTNDAYHQMISLEMTRVQHT